jgi:hypothetical protein
MRDVAARGVHERRGVEVAIMVLDELGDGSAGEFGCRFFGHDLKIILANDTRAETKSNLKLKVNLTQRRKDAKPGKLKQKICPARLCVKASGKIIATTPSSVGRGKNRL